MPQCFGSTPWITTWMCAGSAPLDSARAFVRASIILGTDSSVTRRSYSLTSMNGIAPPPVVVGKSLSRRRGEARPSGDRRPDRGQDRIAAAVVERPTGCGAPGLDRPVERAEVAKRDVLHLRRHD